VRAHLEGVGGPLSNRGATTEKGAARSAKKKAPVK
jgi:starvation-inducible DNA-binding protein